MVLVGPVAVLAVAPVTVAVTVAVAVAVVIAVAVGVTVVATEDSVNAWGTPVAVFKAYILSARSP